MGGNVPTFEEIMAGFAEIRAVQAESAKRSAEVDVKIDKLTVDIDKMREELGNIGKNNGLIAEEIVYHSLEKDRIFAGIEFDFIDRGLDPSKKLPDGRIVNGEYDVFLKNGSAVAIIEVKQRVGKKALKHLIDVQLPRFKLFYPEYKDFKMYLSLGGMSFERGVAEEARRQGIATLMLSGDAVEIDDKDVKAW